MIGNNETANVEAVTEMNLEFDDNADESVEISDEELMDFVSWLKYLEPHQNWLDLFDIKTDVVAKSPSNADEVLNCLTWMLAAGISVQPLFLDKKVWFVYLKSITDKQAWDGLDIIEEHGSPLDVIYYYRAMYRFGNSVIDDKDYDALESLYIEFMPNAEELNSLTADDDKYSGIVSNALQLTLRESTGKKTDVKKLEMVSGTEVFNELNSEKSKSIRPVESWEEVFSFVQSVPNCNVMFSLKIDGINTKAIFADSGNKLEIALSRGRASDSFDYTQAMNLQFEQNNIQISDISGKVTGESFVTLEGLEVIRAKYPDKNYKTPKSTAAAMLRAPSNFSPSDYKCLRTFFFNYNDLRPDQSFQYLQAHGLEVPWFEIISRSDIPKDKEEFRRWLFDNILSKFDKKSKELNLSTDGVVLDLLTYIDNERKDRYTDTSIAIKFGPWSASSYKARVVDIQVEQKKVEASIVLIIEPTVTRDYNTATRVGGISTAMLIEHGVKVGSIIEFVRKSEAYNTYVRCVEV